MKYPKLRELKEAVKALIKGPYTSKFPKEPYVAENFRGKPEYVEDECIGCGACAEVCPAVAIDVVEKINKNGKSTRKLVLHYDICLFCGQCVANCTSEKGIIQTHEYALALFDRKLAIEEVEKELVMCQDCGEVIGVKDQLVFLANKLGLLASGNPLLMLTSQKELGLLKEDPAEKSSPEGRANMFRVLCPKCRRETVITDIWG